MILKCINSGSKGNAYALIAKDEILLMECGMSLKEVKKVIDYEFLKIKGCLVTHEHQDHLKYIREYLSTGIPVYTNEFTKEKIESRLGYRLYGVPEKNTFCVGGFKVIPFYVPHNDIPNFAYIIEHSEMGRLLFATDYEYIPWTFRQWQIQHFLIECNYDMQFANQEAPNYEHVLKGHASLGTCLEVVEKNRTPNLMTVIMCHLSGHSAQDGYFINEMQKVAGCGVLVDCAAAGKAWEVNDEPF